MSATEAERVTGAVTPAVRRGRKWKVTVGGGGGGGGGRIRSTWDVV